MTNDYTPNDRNNRNDNMGAWAIGIVLAIVLVAGGIYWSANSRHTASNNATTNAPPTTGSTTSSPGPATTGSGGFR